MRYAIYTRYSSDLQRETSIEDQIRKCTEYGRAQEWLLAPGGVYVDEAISGAGDERPGFKRLVETATSSHAPFDVILVDDTSRLSRYMPTAIHTIDRLKFAGVRVIAVGQGIDTDNEQADVLYAVHGLVDSLYIKELAKKCHRGMEGAFLRGFHTGGHCYGYRIVPVEGGGSKLVIEEKRRP